ncbi:MAG TPA: hypothetical protein VF178_04080 [Gemmatimonadaceae bacterium]
MRRIIMLVFGAMALAACSNPTAPTVSDDKVAESADEARRVLRIASKAPARAAPKLAAN